MPEPSPGPSGAGHTRRRGAALEEAILRAAADELAESGLSGFTMDKVAARVGTNKNALYRRWPNRRGAARTTVQTRPLPTDRNSVSVAPGRLE